MKDNKFDMNEEDINKTVENAVSGEDETENTRKRGKMTTEEFNALSVEEQNEIIQRRKERLAKIKIIASEDVDEMLEDDYSERQFNGKFNTLYEKTMKIMKNLNAKKKAKILTGEALYDKTIEVLAELIK